MIIPIGHEQTSVRRLPWVSIAILALNLVVFLTVGQGAGSAGRDAGRYLVEGFNYWIERPYLTLPEAFVERLSPAERRQLDDLLEAMRGSIRPPEGAQLAEEQRRLDSYAEDFLAALHKNPLRRWGLIPAQFDLVSLFTSMFMHAGWLHLIGNMFLLYLTAPFVEDAWGRPIFAAVYLGSGAVAALAHVAGFPDSTVPLVGASGAVAGLMGVFLIRFSRLRVKFFYWFFFILFGTFSAPAWIMLLLWLGKELMYASVGAEMGVAYWAHVGGFACGVVAAVVMKQWQVEERFIQPAIEKELSITQHPGLEQGMELLVRGEVAAGRAALQEALAADPRNPDVNLAMWQSYVQEGVPASGLEYVDRLVEHEVRAGEGALAVQYWREAVAAGGTGGSPASRWRLAAMVQDSDPEHARQILEHLARDPAAGELADKALTRIGVLGWPVPESPATETPSGPASSPPRDDLPSRDDPAPSDIPRYGEPHEAPMIPEEPAADPLETADGPDEVAAAVAAVPDMRGVWEIEEYVPRSLDEEGLFLLGGQEGMEFVPFSAVRAVAVAGITGERRFLLLDLLTAAEPPEPERVVRLRSTSFNPCALLERPDLAPMAAFRALLQRILAATGAPLVPPSFEPVRGPLPVFPDEETYHRVAWPLLAAALPETGQ